MKKNILKRLLTMVCVFVLCASFNISAFAYNENATTNYVVADSNVVSPRIWEETADLTKEVDGSGNIYLTLSKDNYFADFYITISGEPQKQYYVTVTDPNGKQYQTTVYGNGTRKKIASIIVAVRGRYNFYIRSWDGSTNPVLVKAEIAD